MMLLVFYCIQNAPNLIYTTVEICRVKSLKGVEDWCRSLCLAQTQSSGCQAAY